MKLLCAFSFFSAAKIFQFQGSFSKENTVFIEMVQRKSGHGLAYRMMSGI